MSKHAYVPHGNKVIQLPEIYKRLLRKIEKYPFKRGGRIVPFSYVNTLFSRTLHTDLDGARELLYNMEKAGLLTVIPYNGVVPNTTIRASYATKDKEVVSCEPEDELC